MWTMLGLLVAALVAAGCGGRASEPPRPDRTITAEAVSIADHWDFGPCDHLTVTLRSGAVLDVARAGITSQGCPEQRPTPFLLGGSADLTYGSNNDHRWVMPNPSATGAGPLVFTGSQDGEPWLATIASPYYSDCWRFRFAEGDGAYLERETIHLATGLVIPLADGYVPPKVVGDAFPLRAGDGGCLNAEGQVTTLDLYPSY
jgi:hypothetical protein